MNYANASSQKFSDSAGYEYTQLRYKPSFVLGTKAEIEIQFLNPNGSPFALNASDTFTAALDSNFLHTDSLMAFANSATITDAENGKISIQLDCNTTEFETKLNGAEKITAWLEVARYLSGSTEPQILVQDQCTCRNRVQTTEGEPSSASVDYYTAAQVTALFAAGAEFQFADENGEWHSSQTTSDTQIRFRNSAIASADWSPAVQLPEGIQGSQGIPGSNGSNGQDGQSTYTYVGYAADTSGGSYSLTPADNLPYRAEIHTSSAYAEGHPTYSELIANGGTFVKYIGDPGVGLVFRGAYNSSTVYSKTSSRTDAVEYEGSLWGCIASSGISGQTPPSLPAKSNDYWMLMVEKGADTELKLGPCTGLGIYISGESAVLDWVEPADVVYNGATLGEWEHTLLKSRNDIFPDDVSNGSAAYHSYRPPGLLPARIYKSYTFANHTSSTKYALFSQTKKGVWNALQENRFPDDGENHFSWYQVKRLVADGSAPTFFPVGTVFEVEHPEYIVNGHSLRFRVVGHDQVTAEDSSLVHTMCLDMVDVLLNAPFDAGEAMYALTADTTAQTGKVYYTYSSGTYTALTEGTDWEAGDPVPASTWYEKNIENSGFGLNDYARSNILQWANSDGNAGQWFVKQTIFDTVHTNYGSKNGFCKMIDPLFLDVVAPAKVTTAKYGGGYSETVSKFFLLSTSQIFGTQNNNISEDTQLTYYQTAENRIKLWNGSPAKWWMRSPYTGYPHTTYAVQEDGTSAWHIDTSTYGVSLACIIA